MVSKCRPTGVNKEWGCPQEKLGSLGEFEREILAEDRGFKYDVCNQELGITMRVLSVKSLIFAHFSLDYGKSPIWHTILNAPDPHCNLFYCPALFQ